jgi:P27 family predicted phage terminase small subunit
MARKTPTKLKQLRGTYRSDRALDNEPEPEPGPVTMPRGVLPKSARKAWHEWVPQLEALGLVTPFDAPMLALTCVWMGVVLDAAGMIRDAQEGAGRDEGLVTEDGRGRARKNRALTALNMASSELRQLSRLFGLTPADRAALEVPEDGGGPTLAEQLAQLAVGGNDNGKS